ncbi:hypothetical protein [Pseudohaliea sp.]|uniref:hypothetical protein n=1 Tax=Pseudohaliea sp. TaxID=2740289 RepID=UPI0032EE0D3B
MRLPDGQLLLHSPVPIGTETAGAIDELGEVAHILCPNCYHHMHAADAMDIWPGARLYGPRGLEKKRPDLQFDEFLEDLTASSFGGVFEFRHIDGSMLDETVLFHTPSGTLVTSDLVENFHHNDHWFTRWYLKLGGVYRKVGWHPLLRLMYRDRRAARQSIEGILQWPIERVVVAHGDNILEQPVATLRQGLAWLLDQ